MAFTITANSSPVYGSKGWSCNDWVTWYNVLPAATRDQTWCSAWTAGISRLGGGQGTAPGSGWFFDSVPIDCRTFDDNFRAFLANNPLPKSAVFSGVFGSTIGKGLSTGAGAIDSGLNVINNLSSTATKFTKAVSIVAPILVFVGSGVLVFVAYKYVNKQEKAVQ